MVQQLFTSCSEHPSLRAQLSESLGGSILKMSKDFRHPLPAVSVCVSSSSTHVRFNPSKDQKTQASSKDKHGCLVIQHALGMAPVEMQSLIGPELRGKVPPGEFLECLVHCLGLQFATANLRPVL